MVSPADGAELDTGHPYALEVDHVARAVPAHADGVAAEVTRRNPYVKALREVSARHFRGNPVGVGRHGASDIVYFQRAGIPGVEFGPVGGGHHGPNEYVVISSLETYRQMLVQFVQIVGRNGKMV